MTWPTSGEPSTGPTGPAGPPAASRRSRRRHTPASHAANAVILAAFTLGCVIASIAIFHDWRGSVATQDNGVRVAAVVVAADEVHHSTRSGSYLTTDLTVQYPTPVAGRTQGLVVAPQDEPQDGVGTTVAVVVDRSDPSHVELQGVAGRQAVSSPCSSASPQCSPCSRPGPPTPTIAGRQGPLC